jgi:L-malate glycosyltransferase
MESASKRKKIIYIGNQLQKHGANPTTIDHLVPRLALDYDVIHGSDVRNVILRLIHMLWIVFRNHRSASAVLIDVYSTFAFNYFLAIAILSKGLNVKYISILHGGNLPSRLGKTRSVSIWAFRNAFVNVTPSLYLKNAFEARDIKTVFIPNFIDIAHYPFTKRILFGPNLLFVRSFHKIYNPQLVVEIFYRLLKKFPEGKLCMVGPNKDGSESLVREKIRELNIEQHVVLPGRLSKSDWIKLSNQYDIFISTATTDNMPVSLIEAMLLGLPIVATQVGGIASLLQHGKFGFSIEGSNPDDYVRQIEAIIMGQGDVMEVVDNARKYATTFDWQEVKSKWTTLLDSVV